MRWEDRIGRRVKLRDVHILLAAAHHGSLGKAADQLAISPPVASKAISDLEHTIGVRLLERSRQGVVPTVYGRAVLKHGLAAFDELRQCIKEIEFLTDPNVGEVRIGAIPPLGATFVSAIIDRVSQRRPRFQFHVTVGLVETLCTQLIDRSIDLFIAWKLGPVGDARLNFEPLYDDSFVVVTGSQNPWARRRAVELSDLVDERWVLPPPESAVGSLARQAFHRSGLKWPRATVVGLPREVLGLLTTGRFLAIVAASTVTLPTKVSGLKILPVELRIPRVPAGIVSLKKRVPTPAAQLVMQHARDLANIVTK